MRDLILDPYLRNGFYDFCMDSALLWTAAAVAKQRLPWPRLCAGAAVGGAYTIWQLLARDGFAAGWIGALPWYATLCEHFLLLPAMMLAVAFLPLRPRRFFALARYFYLVTLLTYGLANTAFYFLQQAGYQLSAFLCICLEIGLALAVGELGWGVVHRQMVDLVCRLPVALVFGELTLSCEGFLDTGNRLCDPLTRQPVIVLDYGVLREHLTPAVRSWLESVQANGDLPEDLPDDPWCVRLRLIPFRSVQTRAGLMPALKADTVRLGLGGKAVDYHSVLVGLEMAGGLARSERQALIPSSLWSWSAAER